MPRVPRGAAVALALLIATAGIGAASGISLTSTSSTVEIGSITQVIAGLPNGGQYTVHLFGGTATGTSFVQIGGRTTRIPVAGSVFAAGGVTEAAGSTTIDALVPDDAALIGATLFWVAVVVDEATGRVIAVARTGGPIIEDAIC